MKASSNTNLDPESDLDLDLLEDEAGEAIVIHLTDGGSVRTTSPLYLNSAGMDQTICGMVCPEYPHYRCSRVKSHKGDHAAHGTKNEMFSRWKR